MVVVVVVLLLSVRTWGRNKTQTNTKETTPRWHTMCTMCNVDVIVLPYSMTTAGGDTQGSELAAPAPGSTRFKLRTFHRSTCPPTKHWHPPLPLPPPQRTAPKHKQTTASPLTTHQYHVMSPSPTLTQTTHTTYARPRRCAHATLVESSNGSSAARRRELRRVATFFLPPAVGTPPSAAPLAFCAVLVFPMRERLRDLVVDAADRRELTDRPRDLPRDAPRLPAGPFGMRERPRRCVGLAASACASLSAAAAAAAAAASASAGGASP